MIETMKVYYKPGKYEMVINASDFDEKVHEKIGEKKKASAKKEASADEELKKLMGE